MSDSEETYLQKTETVEKSTQSFAAKYKYTLIFCLIVLIGTIIFSVNGGIVDRNIADLAYDGSLPFGERFIYEDVPIWHFLNEENDIFIYVLGGFILLFLLITPIFKKTRWTNKYWRFALFSAALGVLILVNFLFKGFYGRPRPIQSEFWPNSPTADMFEWYQVWEPAFIDHPEYVGKCGSFPSGHVSAIATFIVMYYIFKNVDYWATKWSTDTKMSYNLAKIIVQILKWVGFLIGSVGAILTGVGRIVAGKHHASDVLWAIAMVYFATAVMYYYIMDIPGHEGQEVGQEGPTEKKYTVWGQWAIFFVLVIISVLLNL